MEQNSELAVLIGKMLGNVGLLHDEVKHIHDKLPTLKADLESVAEGAAVKLAAAVSEAARVSQAAGKSAGADAVKQAAGEQVKALVGRMALACDELRATADMASKNLKQAVEKVSIWRQVGFCAGAGAVSALVVSLLIWFFGAHITTGGCPATLSKEQCGVYLGGVRMQKIWAHLPAETQSSITAVNQAVK